MKSYVERALHNWSQDSIRLIVTPSVAAKSCFFYVQEVGYFQTEPRYFTEREHLNSYLIVYTLSGKGYLTYKKKTYTLLPNQVFFIDCMEYQFYQTDEESPWEILWVHFNGATSSGYYEQFFKNGSPVLTLEQDTKVPTIIEQLIEIHSQKVIRTEPLSSKLLVEILTELLLSANHPDSASLYIPEAYKSNDEISRQAI